MAVLCVFTLPVWSQETPTVGKCEKVSGALIRKQAKTWTAVKVGDAVKADDFVVAMPEAEIVSADGKVKIIMLADIGKLGPYPVLEAGVRFLEPKKANLKIQFDRGLIAFKNTRKKGAASVEIQVRDTTLELNLLKPDTTVAMEIFSRHKPGLPTIIDGKIEDPATFFAMLVVKGELVISSAKASYKLKAPPGPAKLTWDSILEEVQIETLAELPVDVDPKKKQGTLMFKTICTAACQLNEREINSVLDAFLKSDKKIDQLVGVTALGAIDDLPKLLQAFRTQKNGLVRKHAILVLRNWMGRKPGQVKKLYDALLKEKYSQAHAKTILQLLFGFSFDDREDPATYDILINYLDHSQLPVRELAHWHLVRLAPLGAVIPYDAAGSKESRVKAYRRWRKLIPEGKIPRIQKLKKKLQVESKN
ncbi:MAG: hypothetical protein ACFCD0_07385 [Gemmataceae bacterium]